MLATIDLNYWLIAGCDGHTKLDQQISCELVNGYYPVTRTKRVTPKDQTSLAGVVLHSCDRIASGAK